MGLNDYNEGYRSLNPWYTDYSKSTDYRQGQADAQKDSLQGPQFAHVAGNSCPGPPMAPRKSHFLGVVFTVLAGPLGLFYSSKKGALLLLAGVVVLIFAAGMGAFAPASPAAAGVLAGQLLANGSLYDRARNGYEVMIFRLA